MIKVRCLVSSCDGGACYHGLHSASSICNAIIVEMVKRFAVVEDLLSTALPERSVFLKEKIPRLPLLRGIGLRRNYKTVAKSEETVGPMPGDWPERFLVPYKGIKWFCSLI